ncbi:autophagy-related protein 27 [Clohesyomyces aquaticus]|uniref:Autophagy-related protein 27 n=1 Tax=Clohesyomyces aquaticus TaxID=1231657 RepID=A0A1Y1ZT61_9PLEO|nr:autophagy-related protein 27 [Clohesyomyces aquaticus]
MRSYTSSSSGRVTSGSGLSLSTLSTLFLSFSSLSAGFACDDVVAGGQHFHLEKLGGPFKVHWLQEPDLVHQDQFNYTFTLDLCNKLQRDKGVPKDEWCHPGARVCGIRETIDLSGKNNRTINPIDIAGTYAMGAGRSIDAQFSLLRNSKSHSDASREGVRAELHGGRFPFDETKKNGLDQMAIIEFVCDKERTGLGKGEKDDKEKEDDKDDDKDGDKDGDKEEKDVPSRLGRRADDQCEDSDADLRFCGYREEDIKKDQTAAVLRLEWRTKYACEDAEDDSVSSHWGFFTWFIIILFMATAAYLIFGSWLNYNRYGARGWDLLPHGDTIRDLPYIFKDWARRVAGAVSGPGSRGGYSAV